MFDLIPFEHRNNDLFRYFDDMERAFFGGNTDIAPCKTDILDEGNRFGFEGRPAGLQKGRHSPRHRRRPFDDLRGTLGRKQNGRSEEQLYPSRKTVWFHEPQF